jgi:uncharacterized protein (DUF1800 family)
LAGVRVNGESIEGLMRKKRRFLAVLLVVASACATSSSTVHTDAPSTRSSGGDRFDDASQARQALNRLTFGARAADLATIERMGVLGWLDWQLHPERITDPVADSVLDLLDITHKDAFELYADHPQPNEYGYPAGKQPDTAEIRRKAVGDSMTSALDSATLRVKLAEATVLMNELPRLGPTRAAAIRELPASILIRAVASNRQLLEVMTDFWENHFSVSSDKVASPFTLVEYDRTIRAHALGRFRDLLGAVAKSPAMLFYLDNFQSVVDSTHPNPIEWKLEQRRRAHPPFGDTLLAHTVKRRRVGVNENYARELMELHTLGVDGGYTQKDVQEVARCLTGWGIDNIQVGPTFGFHAEQHDAGEKTVLGTRIQGGRGIEDGEQVLDILSRSPATAHFIAHKLVTHFVSDAPPAALVDRAAQTFLRTDGDIREVMRTIIESPEFNSRAAYRAKVKTPFELVASILRVMDAAPDTTPSGVQLIARLGQPIFGRSTPDGWPDRGDAWMNAGALLNRVNLGAQAGANQLPNVIVARWVARERLGELPVSELVDAVARETLAGDASPATRDVLRSVSSPPGTATQAQRMAYLANLVGVAIGSSDFQRR